MYDQQHYSHGREDRHGADVEYVSLYDPFLVQTLQSILGKSIVVETSKGSIRGKLADVKPDHIYLQSKEASFFIRIQEIVWVMPN